MDYPKLVGIEAFPIERDGQRYICVKDHLQLSDKMLVIPPAAFYILSLLDGKHCLSDIQTEFKAQVGADLGREDLKGILNQLDNAHLLENDNYKAYKDEKTREFLDSDLRPSSHAGLSYPDKPDDLSAWFRDFLQTAEANNGQAVQNGSLRGLVSPHIDYSRGGVSYALAYREMESLENIDTYVILGTSHYADVDNPFIMTRKNFTTPFGNVETNNDLVDTIAGRCKWDLFEGEMAHRMEHSIEFQVAFLQHMARKQQDFTILPILCNSFYSMVEKGISPMEDERVSVFISALKDLVTSLGDRVLLIAGADMAHVGPKFGDPDPVNEDTLISIRVRDTETLMCSERMDAESFYRSVESEKDQRKICGLSPIYTLLSTIDAKRGKILDYDQALEPDTGSVVTYASMGFYS